MMALRLLFKELVFRKGSFAVSTISTVIAVAGWLFALEMIDRHDQRTAVLLQNKQADIEHRLTRMREHAQRAMRRLGFNILIVPKTQQLTDWYRSDYGQLTMPESYVEQLRSADLITVQDLAPVLKQRTDWPEKQWQVLLAGTEGADVEWVDFQAPEAVRLTDDEAVVGHEIAKAFELEPGDRLTFKGRPLTVKERWRQTGSADDVTLWVALDTAQKLLNQEGRINEILALQCRTDVRNLAGIREEIAGILPDTRVMERSSEVIAQAEAMSKVIEKERAALEHEQALQADVRANLVRSTVWVGGLGLLIVLIWLSGLYYLNVKHRLYEIGSLRTLGMGNRPVSVMILGRAMCAGVLGGCIGLVAVWMARTAVAADTAAWSASRPVLALAVGWMISTLAGVAPLKRALRTDPAVILRNE